MRTLSDIERDIADAYRSMTEYRAIVAPTMERHYERLMNVRLDELNIRLAAITMV